MSTVIPNTNPDLVVVEVIGAENGGKGVIAMHSIVAFCVGVGRAYPITCHRELNHRYGDIGVYNKRFDGWTVIHQMGSDTEYEAGTGIDQLGDYLVKRAKERKGD